MKQLTAFLIAGIVIGTQTFTAIPAFAWMPIVIVLMIAAVLFNNKAMQTTVLCIALCVVGILRMTQSADSLATQLLLAQAGAEPSGGLWAGFVAWMTTVRASLEQQMCALGLDGEQFSVAAAMVLGDKSVITHELRQTYSASGAAHVLALSGMHLAIVYLILSVTIKRIPLYFRLLIETLILRYPHNPRLVAFGYTLYRESPVYVGIGSSVLTLFLLWTYVLLVGMPMSAVRAAVMLTVCEIAHMLWRRMHLLDSLCLALFLILLVSPLSLFDLGFQMSVLAVLGIALCFRPLTRLVRQHIISPMANRQLDGKWKNRARRVFLWFVEKLSTLLLLTFSAQLFVLPLVAHTFHQVPVYGFLTSIIVAITATVAVWSGLLLIIGILIATILPFMHWLLYPFAIVLSVTILLQNTLLDSISHLPCALITDITMSFPQMLLIYVVISATLLAIKIKWGK